MKVDVIKGASHSIELIHGETSVCITPDEAENLIAQLRAVVPVPGDVQEAVDYFKSSCKYSKYSDTCSTCGVRGSEWCPKEVHESMKAHDAVLIAYRNTHKLL